MVEWEKHSQDRWRCLMLIIRFGYDLVLLRASTGLQSDPGGKSQVNSGGSEQDLMTKSLGPSEGEEASGPERSGNQCNVLQSTLVGLVSSQDLSDEGSHIGTNTGEVTGTAQVGGQSRGEGVLETVGQESKVEELGVGGLGENSGSGQKSGGNTEKRKSLLDINFKSFGFWNERSSNDGSANVARDALGVEKELGSRRSLNRTRRANGGVGPCTGDSGSSHLGSCQKSRKGDAVDGTRVEGEEHSNAHGGLFGERQGLWCLNSLSRGSLAGV